MAPKPWKAICCCNQRLSCNSLKPLLQPPLDPRLPPEVPQLGAATQRLAPVKPQLPVPQGLLQGSLLAAAQGLPLDLLQRGQAGYQEAVVCHGWAVGQSTAESTCGRGCMLMD